MRAHFRSLAKSACFLAALTIASTALATPPTTYTADSTTNVYAKPSVTDGGAFDLEGTINGTTWTPKVAGHGAGYVFTPTDFYCPMVRVTDPNTRPGFAFFGPGSWMRKGWNTISTRFFIQDDGGNSYMYTFNTSTMAVSQIGKYNFLHEWDPSNPYVCYGASGAQVVKWDFATIPPPTPTTIIDLSSYISGVNNVYECTVSDGNNDGGTAHLDLAASTGGGQGVAHYIVWYDTASGAGEIYDTSAGTIKNLAGTVLVSGITPTFTIHQHSMTRDGRYVWVQPTGNTSPMGPVIWDTTSNTTTPYATYTNGGHMITGFAEAINEVYDHPNTYWWYRQVDSVTHIDSPVSLVANVPSTMLGYDDHACWNQVQAGTTYVPMFTSTIQSKGAYNQSPPQWGDELLGIATADRSGAGANTVWRFAHHRSTVVNHPDTGVYVAGQSYDDYYANAWPNISQDGNWALFQSNWEETLDNRALGTTGAFYFYDDVFIMKLTQSAH